MKIQPLSECTGVEVVPTNSTDLDSIDIDEIIAALKTEGAVYFKGFDVDVEEFEKFTNKFSDDYMDNTGSGSYRGAASSKTDGTLQNVAYVYGVNRQRTFGLPLHADRPYIKSQPELIWFMCNEPAETGGQTILCDGVKVYQGLSESARELFNKQRLKYIRHYKADEWPILFKTESRAEIEQYCKKNDMTCQFDEDGSKSPEAVLDEIKSVCEENTIEVPMQAQDFIMLDNTRLMHGRREFTGENRAHVP